MYTSVRPEGVINNLEGGPQYNIHMVIVVNEHQQTNNNDQYLNSGYH